MKTVRKAAPAVGLLLAVLAAAAVAARHRAGEVHVLGSYTTDLRPRNAEQLHNISLGAAALADVEIGPGEEFSFNGVVGPRTPERGYVAANAIAMGGLEPLPGGGVCQLSSTLYNAALLGGLRLTERTAHSHRVSSVPSGRDATVDYRRLDLRFVNVFAEPVRVRCWVEGQRLHAVVTGQTEAPGVRVDVRRERVSPALLGPDRAPAERAVVRRTMRSPDGGEQTELISDDVYAGSAF